MLQVRASRGALHYATGPLAEGQVDLRRALDMLGSFGDQRTIAYAYAEVGALLVEHGLPGPAHTELQACLACHADNGFSWYGEPALATLGDLELGLGAAPAARERWSAALEFARGSADAALQIRALAGSASALAVAGSLAGAHEALRAASPLGGDGVARALTEVAAGFVALAAAEVANSPTEARDAHALARAKVDVSSEVATNLLDPCVPVVRVQKPDASGPSRACVANGSGRSRPVGR